MTQKQVLILAGIAVVAYMLTRPKAQPETTGAGHAVGVAQDFALIPPPAGQKDAHDTPVLNFASEAM